jgi:hypothetical protein
MFDPSGDLTCCVRCTGLGTAELVARRRLLKAAVFASPDGPGRARAADSAASPHGRTGYPGGVLTGTVVDASPHILAIRREGREERLTMMPGTKAWKGGPVDPGALRTGDRVVLRLAPSRRGVAERVWANIGRVTGVIVERDQASIVVDAGKVRGRRIVVIPSRAASRIQVRFPRLEPGYLIDLIGLRYGGVFEGLVPASSQPAYRADQVPRPPQTFGPALDRIGGSATWHEPAGEPDDVEGVAYPLLDPETDCAEEPSRGLGCVRMPYLSVGSLLEVRNECTGGSRVLPVTGCAAVARLFCDRCVTCGTSPRGRVADLTLASFVALGGELERGCFNATIAVGR